MTTALTTDYADSMPIYCVIHLLTLATWKLLDGWFALALLQFRSLPLSLTLLNLSALVAIYYIG